MAKIDTSIADIADTRLINNKEQLAQSYAFLIFSSCK